MAREIKFRAWHKETKSMLNIWPYEWVKGIYAGTLKPNEFFNNEFEITPDGNSCSRIKGKSVFMSLDGQIIGVVPIDDKTTQSVNYSEEYEIMQFTGLKDKNDKEIYEGDIVKTNYGKIGEVVFHIARSSYIIHDPDHFNEKLCDSPVEVIGNIYENKDLLK